MVEVKVKAVNHDYFVICRSDDEFKMWEDLEKKLQACFVHGKNAFRAFFIFDCPINDQLLMKVLAICAQTHTLFLGVKEECEHQEMAVFHGPIYAGEQLVFHEPTLISCHIPKDCFIEAHASLYVVGEVAGCIDFIHPTCECFASSYHHARIRIFDSAYQNLTLFSALTLYYDNQKIQIIDKGRQNYGF